MSLEADIFAKVSDANSATAALVGSAGNCRVYPVLDPAGVALPYAVFQLIALDPDHTHGGPSTIAHALVQFSAFDETLAGAAALADALTADLDGVAISTGNIGVLQDRRTTFEPPADLHRVDVDLTF